MATIMKNRMDESHKHNERKKPNPLPTPKKHTFCDFIYI